jgi:hypothetical protein
MKISNINNLPKFVKSVVISAPLLLGAPLAIPAQNNLNKDVFEKTVNTNKSSEILDEQALSPKVTINGTDFYPSIVVDVSDNKIYRYSEDRKPIDTLQLKNNKANSPYIGLKVVSFISPNYSESKRVTQIVCLSNIGMISSKPIPGQFQSIIGSHNPHKLDFRFKEGNVVVDDETIQKLCETLKNGQYVLIKE